MKFSSFLIHDCVKFTTINSYIDIRKLLTTIIMYFLDRGIIDNFIFY